MHWIIQGRGKAKEKARTSRVSFELTLDQRINQTTDRECLKRAKDEGKHVVLAGSPVQHDTVKCVVTDTDCLKQAKQSRKKVEIVDGEEGDTIRCAMMDTECLNRAKDAGKKVEVTD